jgi:elongation factor 2
MMMNQISRMMNEPRHIRNVSIIAHVDHGKTSLTETLTHVHMDFNQEEKERGITIKAASVPLLFSRSERLFDDEKKEMKEVEVQYLINLIDSPGHVDFSSEVTASLRITDGSICVVDCIEGVCVQTETVLRQSIVERVKPVLFLNKVDRIWLEQHLTLKECYKKFKNIIESVNAICETYKDPAFNDITIDAVKGNVSFGSGYFGWAFSLRTFARMYGGKKQFKAMDEEQIVQKLWGKHYWNKSSKKWQTTKPKKSSLNGFCEFVLRPIQVLHDAVMNDNAEVYLPIVSALSLKISTKELEACNKAKDRLRLIMSTWLPTTATVLDLCADHLPSPVKAQQYRIPILYTGPLDTLEAQHMVQCNAKGALTMYVSKMIPTKNGQFVAFGRVFSGTIKRGQDLTVLGSAPQQSDSLDEQKTNDSKPSKKKVQGIIMMIGGKTEMLNECPAGNVCAIAGVSDAIMKSGTLTDSAEVHPFKTMHFSVSPVVKVAVNVCNSKDLKKLVIGLKRLSQFDQLLQVTQNKHGEKIIAGAGELHLQTCIRTLREDFMDNVEIKVSNPTVSFCESVESVSGSTQILPPTVKQNKWSYPSTMVAKSTNKLNRLYFTVEPLSNDLCAAIESDQIQFKPSDMKSFGRTLSEQFKEWNKEDAARIWTFGCAPDAKANVIVDQTRGVQYLDKIQSSVVGAFMQHSGGGILCDEPLRGVRYNLMDAKIHSDPAHHGAAQIMKAARKCFAAGQLSSTPTLLEPMYLVLIDVPSDMQYNVFNLLPKVRGVLDKAEESDNNIMCKISAFVPVIETFSDEHNKKLGFNGLLREHTKGKAFATMSFSHWQKVDGDVLNPASTAHSFVMDTRKRKGMKLEIPSFLDYYDKI